MLVVLNKADDAASLSDDDAIEGLRLSRRGDDNGAEQDNTVSPNVPRQSDGDDEASRTPGDCTRLDPASIASDSVGDGDVALGLGHDSHGDGVSVLRTSALSGSGLDKVLKWVVTS